MVNFGLNSASILGIFLAVAGAGLYFLRSIRPELSRDHDIFFAAVGLLCGFILLFQGWRLDPILQFGQFLLTGSTVFFATESIRLRGVATEQARRNTPLVDDDRPVSRVYRAELDQLDSYDYDRPEVNEKQRRLRGSQDSRNSRRNDTEERPSKRNENYGGRPSSNSRKPSSRRPSYPSRYDEWDDRGNEWEETEQETPRNRRPQRPERPERPVRDNYDEYPSESVSAGKKRKKRPTESIYGGGEEDITSVDYVDYQPSQEKDDFDRPSKPESEDNSTSRFDY